LLERPSQATIGASENEWGLYFSWVDLFLCNKLKGTSAILILDFPQISLLIFQNTTQTVSFSGL
jgi:hypothetical protein